jgi:hypothetical protein
MTNENTEGEQHVRRRSPFDLRAMRFGGLAPFLTLRPVVYGGLCAPVHEKRSGGLAPPKIEGPQRGED